jgi:hypothetical protein
LGQAVQSVSRRHQQTRMKLDLDCAILLNSLGLVKNASGLYSTPNGGNPIILD